MGSKQLKDYTSGEAYGKIREIFEKTGGRATVEDLLPKVRDADALIELPIEFMRDFIDKMIISQALSSWRCEQTFEDGSKRQIKRVFSVSNPSSQQREYVGHEELTHDDTMSLGM